MDWLIPYFSMPRYFDVHPLGNFSEATLKKLQTEPKDEFGVTHVNLIYSKEKDKFFCLLDAPNKEAVEKHHHKAGIKCDWVMEVKSTSG
jgi:hypothetical protein